MSAVLLCLFEGRHFAREGGEGWFGFYAYIGLVGFWFGWVGG